MQYGFIIDQGRCIGCHACTVACKSENEVPLGDFRTWVKYTEEGAFPSVKRSFTVLRCNQCTAAPCIAICPVTALSKRTDGIVDIDPSVCIGCKACMQACPYDALYLNEGTGTAQKCHFCAHRTEQGLAPACAVVCPTEAILPGDFDDPDSIVSRIRREGGLGVRKPEAGTGPNVFYKAPVEAGITPMETTPSGGYLFANQTPGLQVDAALFRAMEEKARARTTYNVDHPAPWGWMVSAYLLTKSIAAGIFLAGFLALRPQGLVASPWIHLSALILMTLTAGLLVGDLKRPDRFLLILLRPQWNSWLAKGAVILTAYGILLTGWAALGLLDPLPPRVQALLALPGLASILTVLTCLAAALTAMYTAWLFEQAKGRVLWMKRGLAGHLLFQALVAGSGFLLLASPVADLAAGPLRWMLGISLLLHGLMTLAEPQLAPEGRQREYHAAASLVSRGPFARLHWSVGVGAGILLPAILLALPIPALWSLAGALALIGLGVEEHILVRAGQALPIS